MKTPTIDRLKLLHEVWERKLSNTTTETIVQILENTRITEGHTEVELKAKEILSLIEADISESELLSKLNEIK